jgi:DNA-binding NarL/FixJ family response regulator
MTKRTIWHVEDEVGYHRALRDAINLEHDLFIAERFGTVEDLLASLSLPHKVDLILLDLNLPKIHGVDGIRLIKQADPDVPIVALTVMDEHVEMRDCLLNGAVSFITKGAKPEQIAQAIRAALLDIACLSPDALRAILQKADLFHRSGQLAQPLSKREMEVISLMAKGKGRQAMSEDLNISEHTVDSHIRSLYKKLNASNNVEAVSVAIRRGVI